MGTKIAVADANIFMGEFECNFLSKSSLRISFHERFIDDILIITDDAEANFTKFIQDLKRAHPTIKFTAEYNRNRLTFLDVGIYKGPNFLTTHTH